MGTSINNTQPTVPISTRPEHLHLSLNDMMSFVRDNALTKYTTPPRNYIGSILFLSYIVVALCLTSIISYSLYAQYTSLFYSHRSSPPSRFRQNGAGRVETRNARARHIKLYTTLALISFTSTSWHMLGFLITSFLDWNGDSTRNVLVALSNNAWPNLKHWMLETGLFNDFALQLVSDGESAVWAQLAILATWGWNLWLAYKGELQCCVIFSSFTEYDKVASMDSPPRQCYLLSS